MLAHLGSGLIARRPPMLAGGRSGRRPWCFASSMPTGGCLDALNAACSLWTIMKKNKKQTAVSQLADRMLLLDPLPRCSQAPVCRAHRHQTALQLMVEPNMLPCTNPWGHSAGRTRGAHH